MKILEIKAFWLEMQRERVRKYEEISSYDKQHKLRGSMNAQQMCVRNHTNCVDL